MRANEARILASTADPWPAKVTPWLFNTTYWLPALITIIIYIAAGWVALWFWEYKVIDVDDQKRPPKFTKPCDEHLRLQVHAPPGGDCSVNRYSSFKILAVPVGTNFGCTSGNG